MIQTAEVGDSSRRDGSGEVLRGDELREIDFGKEGEGFAGNEPAHDRGVVQAEGLDGHGEVTGAVAGCSAVVAVGMLAARRGRRGIVTGPILHRA